MNIKISNISRSAVYAATMTSWSDLPYDVQHLISRSYVDLVLTDLEAPETIQDIDSTIDTSIDLIFTLAAAIPFLRRDVIKYCKSLYVNCPDRLSHLVLEDVLQHSRMQTWRGFRRDLNFGLAKTRRFGRYGNVDDINRKGCKW